MNLNEIKERLSRADKELEILAQEVKQMIPKESMDYSNPRRDDPMWLCHVSIGGAGSAVARARRELDRAIKEL